MTKPTPPPPPHDILTTEVRVRGVGKKRLYSLWDALFARVLLKRETRFFYRALASFDVEAKVILKAGSLYQSTITFCPFQCVFGFHRSFLCGYLS